MALTVNSKRIKEELATVCSVPEDAAMVTLMTLEAALTVGVWKVASRRVEAAKVRRAGLKNRSKPIEETSWVGELSSTVAETVAPGEAALVSNRCPLDVAAGNMGGWQRLRTR